MNFDALHAFGAFAEHLNFTRSAESLGISQPALHTKIRKLGEELELVLYEKHGRELRLTADGEALARFAREIKARTREFQGQLRGAHSRPLVFAAGRGAHQYLLGGALKRYLRRYPGLRLPIMKSAEVVAGVRSGHVDLGITTESIGDSVLASRIVRRVGQVVVVPKGHRLATRSRLKPADLRNEELIVPPAGRAHRRSIETVVGKAGTDWLVSVEADGWELMLHFVREGLGLAIVNDVVSPSAGLRMIPITGFDEIVYSLVWKRSMRSERIDFLIEQVRKRQP